MEIAFKTERLKRDCTEDRWMRRALGANRSKILRRRLDQVHAAETLADLRLVHPRTHGLSGDHAGQISLDLDGAYRLLIEPVDTASAMLADGGLDWALITA